MFFLIFGGELRAVPDAINSAFGHGKLGTSPSLGGNFKGNYFCL